MQLSAAQLASLGDDSALISSIDAAIAEAPVDRLGVAVSGGGDSMAVLHAATRWGALSGVPVEAVTVNHGLRAEAQDEADFVARHCDQWGVSHQILHWDGARASGNIAAAGREARYRLIAGWAGARGVDTVLLGHTQDDVAETFLMRLARKSGVDGLAIMGSQFRKHDQHWARPFLQHSRAELRAYLRRHGLTWVEDPTNEDESHERPKARKALAALAPLGITGEVLKTVALNMGSARSTLEHYASEEARQSVRCEAGDVVINLRRAPPPEIQRRLLIAALRYVGQSDYAPRLSALTDLDAGLLKSDKHTLAGCVVTRENHMLRVSRELNACMDAVEFSNRRLGKLWDRRWLVTEIESSDFQGRLRIGALGTALATVPDWREIGLPRGTLMASPGLFSGAELIAAPVAGFENGFEARIDVDFTSFLLSR